MIKSSLVGGEESGESGKESVYPYGIFDKVDAIASDGVEDVENIIMDNREKCKQTESANKPKGRRRRAKKNDNDKDEGQDQDIEVIKDDLSVPEIRKLFTEDHLFKFGTPNPDSKLTDVPCGGAELYFTA